LEADADGMGFTVAVTVIGIPVHPLALGVMVYTTLLVILEELVRV
jgi:type IV secretory pathway VirB3-like protein